MAGEYLGNNNFNAREYPETTTVGSLKAFIAKLTKLARQSIKLQFRPDNAGQQVLQDMDDDDKSLADYFYQPSALVVVS